MNTDPELAEVNANLDKLIAQLPRSKPRRAAVWLLDTVRRHPVATLAIAVALFIFLVIFAPAFVLGIRHGFSNKTIENTKAAAESEKTAAEGAKIEAGQIEIERKAEDLHRETQLKPQRKQAAATLDEATRRRKAAEDLYEKTRNDRRAPDLDDLALRQRNCSDLRERYPDTRFAGCH